MSNIAVSLPNHEAVFRYSFRNTGDVSWPADELMNGGAGSPSDTFASPVCDELRLTATFTDAALFSLVHFSSLSILEGLDFSVDDDATTLANETMVIESEPKPKRDFTIGFAQVSADVIVITITGLNQNSLTFDQVTFGKIDWQPSVNFSDETQPVSPTRYTRQRTRQSNRQRISDKSRVFELFFWNATKSEYRLLDYLLNVKAENGYCLLLIDPDSDAAEDGFLANLALNGYDSTGETKQFKMGVVEVNSK